MIRLTPAAAQSLRTSFAEARKPNTSITQVMVTNGALLNKLLGLPTSLGIHSIKPFIAQNSVVFPDIRQRMNPVLFEQHFAPQPIDKHATLRRTEEKVSRWFELRYDANLTPEAVARVLSKNPVIELAEPRYIRRTQFVPNDSLLPQQEAILTAMNLFNAWDHMRCDSNMIVANVDVGVDWTHPDLNPAVKTNWGEMGLDDEGNEKWSNAIDDDGNGMIDDWHGWDFAGPFGESSDNDTRTDDTHGTHTTGITAAVTNNRIGVAGIAFGASILPIKAADNFGTFISFGYEGIVYAANMGVRIVNCSWGGRQRSQAEDDVIQYAYSKNTIIIAASGNNGFYQDFYPASYDHVLSVGSINEAGNRDYFTNYGVRFDVGAPGNAILSTVPGGGYSFQTGTSMSTPQVSGAMALVLAQNPQLSAGQAMEVIRASARGNKDSTVKDLLGRGLIDVGRAVTDTNLFSARIENVKIFDGNNDGILAAGETGAVELTVLNYLRPLKALKAKIEFVDNGEYILTNTKELNFGETNTLSVVKNLQADFRFFVQDTTPENTTVLVKVILSDEQTGYGPDVDYFRMVVNPSYRDLNKNNLVVTFDSKGGIGYNDPVEHTQGSGVYWQGAPPQIPSQARSVIYQGGLMISMDSFRVVSIAPAEFSNFSDQDFAPVQRVQEVTPPDHPKAIQELHTIYHDTKAPDSVQVGVTVDQRSYEFEGGLASNAVVVDYTLRKRETEVQLPHSNHTNIALYMDWDIGPSGALNYTWYTESNNTALIRRLDVNYPFVGMRIVSEMPSDAMLNFHAIQNDGEEGIVETYGGFDAMEKWMSMTIDRTFAGPSDVSMVYGIENAPMKSEDSIRLTYIIAVGVDSAETVRAIEETEKLWRATSSVTPVDASISQLQVYPNPFTDRISAIAPGNGSGIARLIDPMGRIVYEQHFDYGSIEMHHLDLPSGFYVLEVEQGTIRLRKQLVRVK